jgi:DHA2 family multidrug resistance protein
MSGALAEPEGRLAATRREGEANPWLIALVVTLATFMEVLDTTIVNVSLPYIAGSMSASNDQSTWTLTSYLVANGIVLPISGWLSALFGRKRYFLICIAAFTLFSFLCGSATSLSGLILFRLLQGFFGGGLQPSQQAIILDTFPPALRGRAFGIVAMAIIVAPVLGPTLGGWLTDHYSWRWIFFLNVPIGVITLIGVGLLVEDPPYLAALERERRQAGIDYLGLSLIVLGFGCLQVFMDRGEQDDWLASPFIRIMGLGALIGLGGAALWLWQAKAPVVRLQTLRDRNFALGCLMIFATGLVLYASAVMVPLLAQTILGYTSFLAGLLLAPGAFLVILTIPFVIALMARIETRLIIAFGFAALGGALFYSWRVVPGIDFGTLLLMRTAQSFGLAFLFVPISTVTFATLPVAEQADGTALFTMFRNLAGSIGISAATSLITERSAVHQAHLVPHLTPLDPAFTSTLGQVSHFFRDHGMVAAAADKQALGWMLSALETQSSVLAYADVFLLAGAASLLIVPFCFLLDRTKGSGGGLPH